MRAQLRLIASYLAAITGEVTKIRKLAEDQFEQSLQASRKDKVQTTLPNYPKVTRYNIDKRGDRKVALASMIVTRVDGSAVQIEFDPEHLGDLDFAWAEEKTNGMRAWVLRVEQR